jgi:hypothetical protein
MTPQQPALRRALVASAVAFSTIALGSCASEPTAPVTSVSASAPPTSAATVTPTPSGAPASAFAVPTTCEEMTAGIFDATTEQYPLDVEPVGGPTPPEDVSETITLLADIGGSYCSYVFRERESGGGLDGSGQSYGVGGLTDEARSTLEELLGSAGYAHSVVDGRDVYALADPQQGEYDTTDVHVLSDEAWISATRNLPQTEEDMLALVDGVAGNVDAW